VDSEERREETRRRKAGPALDFKSHTPHPPVLPFSILRETGRQEPPDENVSNKSTGKKALAIIQEWSLQTLRLQFIHLG